MTDTPSEREPLLQLERVRVQFGSLVAVRDVDLELAGGDLVGLVGPNGAGKTTLLRAIASLQPMTCGRVRVLGGDVQPGAHRVLRHIGFTPDMPPVFDQLTVRDFLRFIGKGYGIDGEDLDEKIDFWLEQVWLKSKADQRIKSLSRGMHQRIGIARTLLPNPPVVLLDEPAAGLDPAGRVQFRQLLCSLRDQGKAMIVSSHILADLKEYCTHIAIMAQGSIMQYGRVSEIAAAGNGDRCRYTIELVHPTAGIEDLLGRIEGISHVSIDRHHVVLEFSHAPDQAAALLGKLVREGLPIASFTPNRPDLEEMYLRTGIRQVD